MVQLEAQVVALVKAVIIAVAGYIIARSASPALEKIISREINAHIGRLARNLTFYALIALALLTAIGQFIDLTALLAAAGIAGIAIGLASQRSVSNIISGLFLLIDQPFTIGDAVSVGEDEGTVIDMSLLSTRLRTFDNKYLRIPNDTVAGSKIINYTKFDIRRVDMEIGIAYKEEVGKAIEVLIEMAKNHNEVLVEPEPQVFATKFSESSVDLVVRAWVPRTEFFRLRSELIMKAKKALEEAGIEIPFPHRTIYLGSGEIEKLKKQ